MTKNISFLCLLVAQSLAVSLYAQSSNNSEQNSRISFRVMGLHSGIDDEIYSRAEGGFQMVDISHHRPGKILEGRLLEDGTLPLFSKQTGEDGREDYIMIAKTQVPSRSRQILILAAKSGGRLVTKAVADNLSGSGSDWLFINASNMPLAVRVGEEGRPIPISPGQSVPQEINLPAGIGARVQIAGRKPDGWERIYSTYWPVYERQRKLILFMEKDGEIVVRNIPEAVLYQREVNPQG